MRVEPSLQAANDAGFRRGHLLHYMVGPSREKHRLWCRNVWVVTTVWTLGTQSWEENPVPISIIPVVGLTLDITADSWEA